MSGLAVIILAAGKGTRMKSDLPKVFHEILGEPMLTYVLETVKKLAPRLTLLVVGHKRDLIMDYYKDWKMCFILNNEKSSEPLYVFKQPLDVIERMSMIDFNIE